MRELILGGQRSGKSGRAEMLTTKWLGQSPAHRAVFIATAQAWDDEMRERIATHQRDRAQRLPDMQTVEAPVELPQALAAHSQAGTLVVVDCLTLWLTNLLMPTSGAASPGDAAALPVIEAASHSAMLLAALAGAQGPVVLVSNEIGLGVVPMGRDVRAFVDAQGRLNQEVAAACDRVTLMTAGLSLTLKGAE